MKGNLTFKYLPASGGNDQEITVETASLAIIADELKHPIFKNLTQYSIDTMFIVFDSSRVYFFKAKDLVKPDLHHFLYNDIKENKYSVNSEKQEETK